MTDAWCASFPGKKENTQNWHQNKTDNYKFLHFKKVRKAKLTDLRFQNTNTNTIICFEALRLSSLLSQPLWNLLNCNFLDEAEQYLVRHERTATHHTPCSQPKLSEMFNISRVPLYGGLDSRPREDRYWNRMHDNSSFGTAFLNSYAIGC